MSDEILNRIEKHMEGTQLGLSALSEVLQKMDARIEHEAEASYELAKAEEEALARTILDKLKIIGDDKSGTYLFDKDIESIVAQTEINDTTAAV